MASDSSPTVDEASKKRPKKPRRHGGKHKKRQNLPVDGLKVSSKKICRGRMTMGKQNGLFLKGVRSEFLERLPLNEENTARRDEDLCRLIDLNRQQPKSFEKQHELIERLGLDTSQRVLRRKRPHDRSGNPRPSSRESSRNEQERRRSKRISEQQKGHEQLDERPNRSRSLFDTPDSLLRSTEVLRHEEEIRDVSFGVEEVSHTRRRDSRRESLLPRQASDVVDLEREERFVPRSYSDVEQLRVRESNLVPRIHGLGLRKDESRIPRTRPETDRSRPELPHAWIPVPQHILETRGNSSRREHAQFQAQKPGNSLIKATPIFSSDSEVGDPDWARTRRINETAERYPKHQQASDTRYETQNDRMVQFEMNQTPFIPQQELGEYLQFLPDQRGVSETVMNVETVPFRCGNSGEIDHSSPFTKADEVQPFRCGNSQSRPDMVEERCVEDYRRQQQRGQEQSGQQMVDLNGKKRLEKSYNVRGSRQTYVETAGNDYNYRHDGSHETRGRRHERAARQLYEEKWPAYEQEYGGISDEGRGTRHASVGRGSRQDGGRAWPAEQVPAWVRSHGGQIDTNRCEQRRTNNGAVASKYLLAQPMKQKEEERRMGSAERILRYRLSASPVGNVEAPNKARSAGFQKPSSLSPRNEPVPRHLQLSPTSSMPSSWRRSFELSSPDDSQNDAQGSQARTSHPSQDGRLSASARNENVRSPFQPQRHSTPMPGVSVPTVQDKYRQFKERLDHAFGKITKNYKPKKGIDDRARLAIYYSNKLRQAQASQESQEAQKQSRDASHRQYRQVRNRLMEEIQNTPMVPDYQHPPGLKRYQPHQNSAFRSGIQEPFS